MPPRDLLVSFRDVVKDYRGLRPLRIRRLDLVQGFSLALLGLDPLAAEVLTNLMTGTTVPDEGDVIAFGASTRAIANADQWLKELDRFGLVSDRVVLLDRFSVEQNLAVPFSLELEDLPADVRERVRLLAEEVGVMAALRDPIGTVTDDLKLRVRLGKALALDPPVVIAEHPNAVIPSDALAPFTADFRRIVEARGVAALTVTADEAFARAVAEQVLVLQPATGELKEQRRWRWFS